MTYKFSRQSERLLRDLHPTLLLVVRRAMAYQALDITVISVKRSEAQQIDKILQGSSRTKKSKHIPGLDGLSQAIDLAPYPIDWSDSKRFGILKGVMIAAATEEGVKIRCGGNWDGDNDFKDNTPEDTGHFELI